MRDLDERGEEWERMRFDRDIEKGIVHKGGAGMGGGSSGGAGMVAEGVPRGDEVRGAFAPWLLHGTGLWGEGGGGIEGRRSDGRDGGSVYVGYYTHTYTPTHTHSLTHSLTHALADIHTTHACTCTSVRAYTWEVRIHRKYEYIGS